MEETNISDIVTEAVGNSEACFAQKNKNCPPPPLPKYIYYFLLDSYCGGLDEQRIVIKQKLSGASHAFATFHHGIWHLVLVLFWSKWIN